MLPSVMCPTVDTQCLALLSAAMDTLVTTRASTLLSYLERYSKAGNCFCIPEAEIDKRGQIIGLHLKKVIVNNFQGTFKQGVTGFPSSHSCSLYTLLPLISEALPEVIFIFLANMSKRLQMLNAVYILLDCATD